MRIAVIGAGISGNLAGRLLSTRHEVQLFESNSYAGGHSNTVDVEVQGQTFRVDTGFMVFNERTYPHFCQLLRQLNVATQDGDMSFSVYCQGSGLEYQGSSLNGLFAQRSNLIRLKFYHMIADILRFNRQAVEVLQSHDPQLTLRRYLQERAFSQGFVDHYLVPMAAAIWSARPDRLLEFPAHFLIAFFRNHGLLQLSDRPQWKTIVGGSRNYVSKLIEPIRERVRLSCGVSSVTRHADHVVVRTNRGEAEVFDQVVFAAHADQVLQMLTDADAAERRILGAFPYQRNDAVLHTDTSLLPRRRRAWASWNYHIPRCASLPVAVTYDLSRLQNVDSPQPILLTLNHGEAIDSQKILRRFSYEHPAYCAASIAAQQQHAAISGRRRTHYCGAYWGYGFHEDGVNSALAVSQHFDISLDACTAASTKASSSTNAANR